MSEETEANPVSGEEVTPEQVQEALAPDVGAEDDEEEAEDDELEKLAGVGAEEGEPELAEIEINGKKYQIHPDLKDGYLMQSDYTKKTMDLAEQRRNFEATRAQFDELATISQEGRASLVQAAALKMQLDSLLNMPVDDLSQEQINSLRMDVRDMETQIAQLEDKGKSAAEQERIARSQQFAKAREAVVTETAKIIPNFDDKRRTELEAFAATLGASPEFVQQITDPLVYKTLHLAHIGQKFIDSRKKATTLADAQKAKPAEQVGGKAKSGKNPSQMSPAEMAKFLGY